MALDNLLKGVVDSIAEELNDAGGFLLTRLRAPHVWGQNDASVLTAAPTTLTSRVDVFDSSMIAELIDVLAEPTPTGNEGTYRVAAVIDAKNVTVETVDGVTPAFVDQASVRWRLASLQTETTWQFPEIDRQLALWVGQEPALVPYARLDSVIGAHRFIGLGDGSYREDGVVAATSSTIRTAKAFFDSSMIGHALWTLSSSNPGYRRITAVTSSREATIAGDTFAADETGLRFVVKTYADAGYLTRDHKVRAQVVLGSQGFSGLDKLRRAFLINFAEGDELDRIGRTLAVDRPRGMSDVDFRCVLKTLTYLPKGTEYGLELLLSCLYPGDDYEIYEDLVSYPCTVFIDLPLIDGAGTAAEGKAFLGTSSDVSDPIDPTTYDASGRELATSSSTTAVAVAHEPITVGEVIVAPVTDDLDMTVLPSADGWTWDPEGAGTPTEAACAAVTGGWLTLTQATPPSQDCGGWYRDVPEIDMPGLVDVSLYWRADTLTTVDDRPWHLGLYDGWRELFMFWNGASVILANADRTVKAGPVTPNADLDDGNPHRFRIRRVAAEDGRSEVFCYVDGQDLFGGVDVSVFATSFLKRLAFGHLTTGANQDWSVSWDSEIHLAQPERNHYNFQRQDGSTTGADDNLGTSSFWTASDVGVPVRILNGGNEVRGLWQVKTYNGGTSVALEGVTRDRARVWTDDAGDHWIELDDRWFHDYDVGKQIEILGAGPNAGTRAVVAFVSPTLIQVGGGDFVTEDELSWRFNPNNFSVETGLFWEAVGVGSNVGPALTLRDPLPSTTTVVAVGYTSVLSAQLLRSHLVRNEGSAGAAGAVYYPFYLFDAANQQLRDLIDAVTAAGVIPEFERRD